MGQLTILIIEDHLLSQHMLRLILRDYVQTCDAVTSVEAAQQAIAKQSYDVIFIDLGLPDGDGVTLAHNLRQQGINVPLIGLTSQLALALEQIDASVFTAVLQKPVTLDGLVANQALMTFLLNLTHA